MVERITTSQELLEGFLNGVLQVKANYSPLDVDSSRKTSLIKQDNNHDGELTEQIIRKICQAAAVFAIGWCDVCRARR